MNSLFLNFLRETPTALALIRSIECKVISNYELKPPVLDVGCGDGLFASICFNSKFDVGIDINPKELELARKRKTYARVELCDVTQLPFENETFQTVFSNGMLEHIPNLDQALSEISRVLKPKGFLITTSPSKLYSDFLFFRFIPGYKQLNNLVFSHHNLFDHHEWGKFLERANLKLLEFHYYNHAKTIKVFDLLLPFTFPSFIWKKLLNRYYLFPFWRKVTAPLIEKLFLKFIPEDSKIHSHEGGASILLVAQKT